MTKKGKTIHQKKGGSRDSAAGGFAPGFGQEVVAITGIFLACFISLCLFSHLYSAEKNLVGNVGTRVAEGLFEFIGWGAWFLPALLFISSLLFFLSRLSFFRLPHLFAGLSGAVLSFCGILAACCADDDLSGSAPVAGGVVGRFFFTMLEKWVGYGGSLLIFLLVLLISLMVAVRFSPYRTVWTMIHGTGTGILYLLGRVRTWWQARRTVAGDDEEPVEPGRRRRSGFRRKGGAARSEEERGEPAVVFAVKAVAEEAGSLPSAAKESSAEIDERPLRLEKADSLVPVVHEKNSGMTLSAEAEKFAARPIARGDWKLPPLSLMSKGEEGKNRVDRAVYHHTSQLLVQKLLNFGVKGRVEGIRPGPVVTTYEYAPAPGVKINKIAGLADDIALGLKASSVRVAGSVPGKAALGIEIPNRDRQTVNIRRLLASDSYRKQAAKKKLTIVLGLDVFGDLAVAQLDKMPHLLIAGATGAGKSVGINTIIASLLYNATPEEVRFLMIDPKMVELSGYEGIPHLLHPVVIEPKLASRAFNWAVREMERRYALLQEAKVKSFDSYNAGAEEKLPYIVIIVDELADLMMVASKDIEASIARLAQMARAAGMHVILATQRPSVDVLTGLIKANFPSRISFKVSSKIDSRTILDSGGAEHLLGRGDMLYLPNGGTLQRVHGAFISEKESAALVEFWKAQGSSDYDQSIMAEIEKESGGEGGSGEEEYDEFYDQAVAFVTEQGQASISKVQRRLRVGYNRAARMIEMMERDGIVGPADGAKPREVIVRGDYGKL